MLWFSGWNVIWVTPLQENTFPILTRYLPNFKKNRPFYESALMTREPNLIFPVKSISASFFLQWMSSCDYEKNKLSAFYTIASWEILHLSKPSRNNHPPGIVKRTVQLFFVSSIFFDFLQANYKFSLAFAWLGGVRSPKLTQDAADDDRRN